MTADEPAVAGAIPAATLILVRERDGAAPEILMLERAAGLVFAGGALVFPGGRVDAGDRTSDDDWAAARVAAIRETIEEAGVAPGLHPPPDAATATRLRAGLVAGHSLPALIGAERLAIDYAALLPLARWCPPFAGPRVFDARFFLARAGSDVHPTADGGECVDAFWTTALAALDGARPLLFPTRMVLERLAQWQSWAAMAEDAAAHPPRLIVPALERRRDGEWLTIPTGIGYPVSALPAAALRRY